MPSDIDLERIHGRKLNGEPTRMYRHDLGSRTLGSRPSESPPKQRLIALSVKKEGAEYSRYVLAFAGDTQTPKS